MMRFGIREKVALLVMVATAASAFLIAKMLLKAGVDAVREHELVDLGDESLGRGWNLADQISGLEDDLMKLATNPNFSKLAYSDKRAENKKDLEEMAKENCRRYWKRHLRIDICTPRETRIALKTKAQFSKNDIWFPGMNTGAGAGFNFSKIQRVQVTYDECRGVKGKTIRWEPVLTVVARINRPPEQGAPEKSVDSDLYLRIAMTLENNKSPRHLFLLEDETGDHLVHYDENESETKTDYKDRANYKTFENLHSGEDGKLERELKRALGRRERDKNEDLEQVENPKVARLVLKQDVPLKKNYYFLEGIPEERLKDVLDTDVKSPFETADQFDSFLDGMTASCEKIGRVGGLAGGVKELRLLADSKEKLEELKGLVMEKMEKHYGKNGSGNKNGLEWLKNGKSPINWRDPVICTKIHIWTVLLTKDGQSDGYYLLHYCVMDEELASAISNEMKELRIVSVGIAAGFGALGFLIVMFFINPLKKMTRTAQKITESHPDTLFDNLGELTRDLDIKRRDEVGDIARASKRLFEELIVFHEQLEQRVKDRTRELRKSNIDLEQAYEQLMSLSHEKDAFVAKVSHDLRQPLNAIFLQVEALKLSDLDDVQKDDVQRIHDHARRELNLVNDILEYQKIIMGAETLNKDEIDVAALINDIEDVHGKTAEAKGLKFNAQFDDDIGSLVADDRRLHQILGNLVGNSVKFTKEGSVSINAHGREISDEPWVEFTVTDTGRGMSPAEQSKVFVPFVSNKKDNAGGSGLGLSICKELTTQMGGKVGFVSELDKGTHFSVFIPRIPTSEHYDEKKQESLTNPISKIISEDRSSLGGDSTENIKSPGGNGTVLVIDDDQNVRELLKRLLEGDGYTVITAEDGNIGLELAREHLPDAITLDVVMPGGKDGWQVLKHLKDSPETESIPVIMVSVMAGDQDGAVLDVEDYLVKPIDVNRLKRVVGRVTREASQRNLLLVDDDVDSLESLSRLLHESGWQTTLATNGKEALAVLEKTLPAAIVLDLMMPEMDGFEFLQRIRSEPTLRSIPVVIMTGKIPSADEKAFLRSHVTTILTKGEASGADLLKSINERIDTTK